jgi:hypothetical protein
VRDARHGGPSCAWIQGCARAWASLCDRSRRTLKSDRAKIRHALSGRRPLAGESDGVRQPRGAACSAGGHAGCFPVVRRSSTPASSTCDLGSSASRGGSAGYMGASGSGGVGEGSIAGGSRLLIGTVFRLTASSSNAARLPQGRRLLHVSRERSSPARVHTTSCDRPRAGPAFTTPNARNGNHVAPSASHAIT